MLLSGRYMNILNSVELDFIGGMLTMDDEVLTHMNFVACIDIIYTHTFNPDHSSPV